MAGYHPRVTRPALLAALLLPGTAFAQVSVNNGALDRLQPASPPAHAAAAPAKPGARPQPRHPAHPVHPAAPARAAPSSPHTANLRPGLPPTVPAAPPSGAALPPPVVPPARPVAPPPPVPIVPNAPGDVSQIKGGIRVTFGAGVADMSGSTEGAVRSFADTVKAEPGTDLNVYAFAAGVPDDPSTPRRLSLARALAIRAILISDGIVSTRIYPRALGASPGPAGSDAPSDRVDLLLATTPAATP